MIYFINGTFNAYNTAIETRTVELAQTLIRAGKDSQVILMQADLCTASVLAQQQPDAPVKILYDWLQNREETKAQKIDEGLDAYQAREVNATTKMFYDDGQHIATEQSNKLGEVTVTFFDRQKHRLQRNLYDSRGFLSREQSFDDTDHLTTTTWLAKDGTTALQVSYDQAGQSVLYQVPDLNLVVQTQTQLWQSLLTKLVKPGDTVISMRREYDRAVLQLPASVSKVASVYHSLPENGKQFKALLVDHSQGWPNEVVVDSASAWVAKI